MIRKAEIKDTEELINGIVAIWEDMESPFVTQIPLFELKEILRKCMLDDDFRYRYSNGIVCERNKEVAGFIFGYKGEEEPNLDQSFKQILTEKNYDQKIDLSFDKETKAGEWYVDMVFTQPNHRKQGVAAELLEALPQIAREAGEPLIALNCDLVNEKARKVYEKQGFQKESEIMIVGHDYDHMIKEVE